ncbi:MAG: hypothetical protein A3F84_26175 [Candidatus Handelsmanbacteria bacterium RIFCSPLOWO2_12_FULL_64_10]|uniref:Response regulatory domain-containing protein n=1 Tax=Handelsmanbacteria sp. (strain RIFCSPLOWO2_12_FULL_64_10) TaxID=1817868 RepID=A0A1F6CAH8_HANXR|nr:MAG: hypothetical protein A3F84_26175 [Candidatus Handelsmanbacteria bacterium RIFCSPLOWO2_12_FULL_64_10]
MLKKQELLKSYEDGLREGMASVFLPVTVPWGRGRRMPQRKVLLMDSDPHVLDGVGCFLIAWGLTVRCEATAVRCRAILREEVPDLLLLGRRLRDGDGSEVLKEVRVAYPDLPVLMIGASTPDAEEEALRRGAQGFLTRPFRAEDLEREVIRALGEMRGAVAFSEGGCREGEDAAQGARLFCLAYRPSPSGWRSIKGAQRRSLCSGRDNARTPHSAPLKQGPG